MCSPPSSHPQALRGPREGEEVAWSPDVPEAAKAFPGGAVNRVSPVESLVRCGPRAAIRFSKAVRDLDEAMSMERGGGETRRSSRGGAGQFLLEVRLWMEQRDARAEGRVCSCGNVTFCLRFLFHQM